MQRRTLLKLLSAPVITGYPLVGAEPRPNRVVISGAGIIGASIAYHLAQRGAEVTVLEKRALAAARPGILSHGSTLLSNPKRITN